MFNEVFGRINEIWPHRTIISGNNSKYVSFFTKTEEQVMYSVCFTPIIFESPIIKSVSNIKRLIVNDFNILIGKKLIKPYDIMVMHSCLNPNLFMNKMIHEISMLNLNAKDINDYTKEIELAYLKRNYFYSYPIFIYKYGD